MRSDATGVAWVNNGAEPARFSLSATFVPEPAAWALAILSALVAKTRRRRIAR
jgi:hypothetical protein